MDSLFQGLACISCAHTPILLSLALQQNHRAKLSGLIDSFGGFAEKRSQQKAH